MPEQDYTTNLLLRNIAFKLINGGGSPEISRRNPSGAVALQHEEDYPFNSQDRLGQSNQAEAMQDILALLQRKGARPPLPADVNNPRMAGDPKELLAWLLGEMVDRGYGGMFGTVDGPALARRAVK